MSQTSPLKLIKHYTNGIFKGILPEVVKGLPLGAGTSLFSTFAFAKFICDVPHLPPSKKKKKFDDDTFDDE